MCKGSEQIGREDRGGADVPCRSTETTAADEPIADLPGEDHTGSSERRVTVAAATTLPCAEITKAEYEALAGFRYALRQFMRFSEEAALAAGLTPQQHQALLAIQGFPDRDTATIGELAQRLQVRHHSAVGLVDRLVAQGLVARHVGETDRRQVYVRLTPQGVASLERLSAVHRTELRRVGPNITTLLTRLAGLIANE